jgi:hypothetical protein
MRLDVRLVNAAAIQASVMGHLQEHMKYLAGNQVAPPLPMQGNSQASHEGHPRRWDTRRRRCRVARLDRRRRLQHRPQARLCRRNRHLLKCRGDER